MASAASAADEACSLPPLLVICLAFLHGLAKAEITSDMCVCVCASVRL